MTYKDLEDVDLVDESGVVLDFLLLNRLDSELLLGLSVLSQVDNTESTIGQLLLERVNILNVAFGRVDEVLLMI